MSTTHNAGVTAETGDARMERELIELSWDRYGTSALIAPVIALVLGAIVFGHVDPLGLALWAAWTTFAYIARAILFRQWTRRRHTAFDIRWARDRLLCAHAVTAVIWGAAALVFIPQLDPLRQALVAIQICGIAGGSAQSGAGLKPAMVVNIAVELLPLALAALLVGGWLYGVMAACVALYAVYLLRIGGDQHIWLRRHLRLRAENEALVERLQAALVRANAAGEAKTQFLANMSHELRTPLNAILGFADMMATLPEASMPPARTREYSRAIVESGRHLLALIGDLLDLTKAEAGRLELDEKPCALDEILAGCVEQLRPMAEKRNIRLSAATGDGAPVTLRADGRKLRQIAYNLLSNAIKFTPEGGSVTLTLDRPAQGGGAFRVADSGVGMSPEDIALALEPFGQVRDPYSKQQEGTGLGLPLTKRLIELHGGEMRIASEPGSGTTVTVLLPARRFLAGTAAQARGAPDSDPESGTGLRRVG